MQKKKLEIQEGSQEQWKHTSTRWIFSLVFLMNKINSERFPPCFWYAPFLFVDQCMQKKKLKIWGKVPNLTKNLKQPGVLCARMPHSGNDAQLSLQCWSTLFVWKKITFTFTATAEVRSTLQRFLIVKYCKFNLLNVLEE